MFVDLYDQLSHRCHLHQAGGGAPLIGPYTEGAPWQLVQAFAQRKEVGLKRIQTLMQRAFHGFPRKMRVGTLNLRTGGVGQSHVCFF